MADTYLVIVLIDVFIEFMQGHQIVHLRSKALETDSKNKVNGPAHRYTYAIYCLSGRCPG